MSVGRLIVGVVLLIQVKLVVALRGILLLLLWGLLIRWRLLLLHYIRHVGCRIWAHFRPVRILATSHSRRDGCIGVEIQCTTTATCSDRWPLICSLGVLLHVLGEIGFLGVGFATVLTDVSLQMLGFLVLGNMLQQRGFIGETFVARVALEGFVRLVASRVRLEIRQLGKCLQTTDMSTFVRFVTGVSTDVLLQVGQLSEFSLANLAPVRFDAQVYPSMLREITRVCECLIALGTFVGFCFTHVNLRVQLEIRFRCENLWAHFALVLPASSIGQRCSYFGGVDWLRND